MKYIIQSFCLLLCFAARSQGSIIHWHRDSTYIKGLPASIKVYTTKDSLDKHAFKAYYVSVDLSDTKLTAEVLASSGKRITPAAYAARIKSNPCVVINGSFFSFKTQHNNDLVISDGKLIDRNMSIDSAMDEDGNKIPMYPTGGVLGIMPSGKPDIQWAFSFGKNIYAFDRPNAPINGIWTEPKKRNGYKWNARQAVGGGPVLLPYISSVEENKFAWQEDKLEPRSAVGIKKDGTLILLSVEGRHLGIAEGATLFELAKIFRQLHCVKALNLDGGGSSCLLVNGIETIIPSSKGEERPVPSVLVISSK